MSTKKKNAPLRTVVTDSGKKYTIAPRIEAGLVPCTGEAHRPEVGGMIDNCSLCAPRWGEMMSYHRVDIDDVVARGYAAPASYVDDEVFERAEKEGRVKLVSVTEKTRAFTASFYVWVRA